MSQSSFGEVLARLWPSGDAKIPGLRDGIVAAAPAVFATYGITTPLLVAHVMAQISHECGAGHDVVENLNYTAGRMMQVWPSRFPTMASAAPYAGNPRALANKVYNGRMGNAPGSDDGWNFRGRGASQTTGREGYARLAKATGLDLLHHPDLVNDPAHFLQCGVSRTRSGILHAAPREAGTVPNTGARHGPGSAAHRSAKSYALRCVRGTALCLFSG